ncbi:hypothetical protein ACHAWU_007705 [Discostella pseudostelligera]|uniref:ADP,ATP carrier protein n=1 Tax=Discostella pseudostelligera TaxID=259834 RepID=A0ABD3M131_9STRA
MRTGSSLSVSAYTPRRRHHHRYTAAWFYIIILIAITSVDVVIAKDCANLLTIPISISSRIGSGASGRSVPLRVARGGTNDDEAVSNENESTDNMKQPLLTNAHAEAAPSTAPATDTSNWRTKLRNVVFPIYGEEMTKFLLIGSIKFFVILALTITRDNKDTMVVTECGAEAIAFLKIYGVLPAATMFIGIYSKMASILDKKPLFYATCIPFFAFFFLFDAIIYPNRGSIQPSLSTVQSIMRVSPSGGGASAIFSKLFANWTSALFYIVAEVYSSVSVGILFWQYANDVVSVSQAKRFYPLFAQMSGIAPIVAGQYVVRYASRAKDFGQSLRRLTWMVNFSGLMICLFYRWSNAYIEKTAGVSEDAKDDSARGEMLVKQKKKKKSKMTMIESARFLASSEYLRLIATLVVGYGLSINFTEIMWKSIVKRQYPNPLDYQRFMGNFSSVVGFSTCIVIFLGVQAIRILGWRIGALATPMVMACLAIPYFSSILIGLDSPQQLRIAVIFGTLNSLLSKTTKYALFDPTTQMAYIPLDDESKVKGKAAIEVLGSRIGKSGGSLVQQFLVLVFGNIISAAPVLVVLYYSVLGWWAYSAHRLSSLFYARTATQERNKED